VPQPSAFEVTRGSTAINSHPTQLNVSWRDRIVVIVFDGLPKKKKRSFLIQQLVQAVITHATWRGLLRALSVRVDPSIIIYNTWINLQAANWKAAHGENASEADMCNLFAVFVQLCNPDIVQSMHDSGTIYFHCIHHKWNFAFKSVK